MKSSIIPKGELLSYGICEYGTEDDQDRHVARNDLLVEELVPNEGMSFGAAIALMKKGKKVCRKGWNGKGQYVKYKMCEVGDSEHSAYHQSYAFVLHFTNRDGVCGIQVGWLASQTDILSEDWMIVE